ncbi:MAG: hypothetical protein KUG77_30115 [Nannocystaceae bacterium]|nr:hypothetical protein [Nannocystaceae bacterium]
MPHTSFEITTGRGRTLSGFSGRVPFADARTALKRAHVRLTDAGLDRETAVTIRVGDISEGFESLSLAVAGLHRIQTDFVQKGCEQRGAPKSPVGSKADPSNAWVG